MATMILTRAPLAVLPLLLLAACGGETDEPTPGEGPYLPDRGAGALEPVLAQWSGIDPGGDSAWGPDPDYVLLGSLVADLANDRVLEGCGWSSRLTDPFGVSAFWVRGDTMHTFGHLSTSGPSGYAMTSCPMQPVPVGTSEGGGLGLDDADVVYLDFGAAGAALTVNLIRVQSNGVVLSACFAATQPGDTDRCGPYFVALDGSVLEMSVAVGTGDLGTFLSADGSMYHAAYIDPFEADRHRQAQAIAIARVTGDSPPTFQLVATIEGPFVLRDRVRPYHVSDRGFGGVVQVSTGQGTWEDRVLLVDFASDLRVEMLSTDALFSLPATDVGTVQPILFDDQTDWLLLPAPGGYGPMVAFNPATGVAATTIIDPPYRMGRSAYGVDLRASGNVIVTRPASGTNNDPVLQNGAAGGTYIRGTVNVRRPITVTEAAEYGLGQQQWNGHGEPPPGATQDWTFADFNSGPSRPCEWDQDCAQMVATGFHFDSGDSFVWLFVDGAREIPPEYDAGQTPKPFGSWEQLWWVDGRTGSDARLVASGVAIERAALASARDAWFAVHMRGDDTGTESTHADTLTGWHVRGGRVVPAFDRQRYVYPRWGSLDGALVWGHRGFFRVTAPD